MAVSAVAAVVATMSATGAGAAAPGAPTIDGPAVVGEAPDFASDRFADPWDYANPLDQQTDEGPVLGQGASGAFVPDDLFRFTSPDGGHMAFVFPGFGGDLPAGRDGTKHPIDANRYSHVSLRVRASEQMASGLLFHTCPSGSTSCQALKSFFLQPGWQTIVVDLSTVPEWGGSIHALRLLTGDANGEGRYDLDWVRVYDDLGDVTVRAPEGAAVYWDADADRRNNTAESPDWGRVGTASKSGTVTFPASAYPPGTYRFYAPDGKDASEYSAPLTIDARPLTVITDPDEQGGEDYIAATTGDAWDMSQPSDAARLQNVKDVAWSAGQLHATNQPQSVGGGQVIGNPIVELRMGPNLDPQRYHRLTVRTSYDGPFSLSFECGGGMHGRLRWWHGDHMHVSREMVLYSDRTSYTWDLLTSPPDFVNESENYANDHGWVGGAVNRVWWDANEDPCQRRWRLEDVALRADDAAKGYFPVRFHDDAHDGRSAVSLYRDTDASGFDGSPIATGVTQQAGQNTHYWWTYGVPAGRWWLHSAADDGTSVARRYATGPVVTDGRPRVAGPDRILTSVATSALAFPSGADAAVVAHAYDFPDALAASAVAAAVDGPTLLNARDQLQGDVATELRRLGVSTVYLMGGTGAQSGAVATALAELPGVTVVRLGGEGRYDTAALAAQEATRLWRDAGDAHAGRDVLLALGTAFADALSASQLAGHDRRPLLLTDGEVLPAATLDALEAMGAERVTIVGGTGAISARVEQALVRAGYATDRLQGPDRFATAAAVADAAVAAGADPARVTVASGQSFPDALGAGPAAVADGGVLLLTDGRILPPPTRAWLGAAPGPATMVKVVGGGGVILDAVVDAIVAASR